MYVCVCTYVHYKSAEAESNFGINAPLIVSFEKIMIFSLGNVCMCPASGAQAYESRTYAQRTCCVMHTIVPLYIYIHTHTHMKSADLRAHFLKFYFSKPGYTWLHRLQKPGQTDRALGLRTHYVLVWVWCTMLWNTQICMLVCCAFWKRWHYAGSVLPWNMYMMRSPWTTSWYPWYPPVARWVHV
jgi:hypothetical protein